MAIGKICIHVRVKKWAFLPLCLCLLFDKITGRKPHCTKRKYAWAFEFSQNGVNWGPYGSQSTKQ
jgi:hypothetical protein